MDISGNYTNLNKGVSAMTERILTNQQSSDVYMKLRKSSTKLFEADFILPENEPPKNEVHAYKLRSDCKKYTPKNHLNTTFPVKENTAENIDDINLSFDTSGISAESTPIARSVVICEEDNVVQFSCPESKVVSKQIKLRPSRIPIRLRGPEKIQKPEIGKQR